MYTDKECNCSPLDEMQSQETWGIWGHLPAFPGMGRPQMTHCLVQAQCSPRDHSWPCQPGRLKKEPFLSRHSMPTPPKDAHSGGQPSDIQKGHSWVKDLQGAEEVIRAKSATVCLSNSFIWTESQGTDLDSLIILWAMRSGLTRKVHFSAQLHFLKNFFNPITSFLKNVLIC